MCYVIKEQGRTKGGTFLSIEADVQCKITVWILLKSSFAICVKDRILVD